MIIKYSNVNRYKQHFKAQLIAVLLPLEATNLNDLQRPKFKLFFT